VSLKKLFSSPLSLNHVLISNWTASSPLFRSKNAQQVHIHPEDDNVNGSVGYFLTFDAAHFPEAEVVFCVMCFNLAENSQRL
jgi:hypothetical protein